MSNAGFVTRFVARYAQKKTNQGFGGIVTLIVSADPQTASEVQIEEWERNFDKFNLFVEKSRTEFMREKQEADTARTVYNQRVKAAQGLQAQIAAGKVELQPKLDKVLAEIESTQADVEREIVEAAEAETALKEDEAHLKVLAQKIQTGRARLNAAMKGMANAKRQKERAKDHADAALARAGLHQTVADVDDLALNAMQKRSDHLREEARTLDTKATLLGGTAEENIMDDPDVKAAMGVTETPAPSAAERVANLKTL